MFNSKWTVLPKVKEDYLGVTAVPFAYIVYVFSVAETSIHSFS